MTTIPTFVNVKAGDAVTVRIHNGAAVVVGVEGGGDRMAVDIESARVASEEAQAVANATSQHFFSDDNGVHVTSKQEEGIENPVADTEHNILINSLGILLRRFSKWLVSITASAVNFYDGDGNAEENLVASFGKDGIILGNNSYESSINMCGVGEIYAKDDIGFRYMAIQNNSSIQMTASRQNGSNYDDASIGVTVSDGYASASMNAYSKNGDSIIRLDNGEVGMTIFDDGSLSDVTVSLNKLEASGTAQQLVELRNESVNTSSTAPNPSETKYLGAFRAKDQMDNTISAVQTWLRTDGANTLNMGVRKYDNAGDELVNNYVRLLSYKDRASVIVSHPEAWINALGIGELHTCFSGKSLAVGGKATSSEDLTKYRLFVVQVANGCQLCLGVRYTNSSRIDFSGMEDNGSNAYRCHGRLEFSGKTVTVIGSTYGNITTTSRNANNVIALYGLI